MARPVHYAMHHENTPIVMWRSNQRDCSSTWRLQRLAGPADRACIGPTYTQQCVRCREVAPYRHMATLHAPGIQRSFAGQVNASYTAFFIWFVVRVAFTATSRSSGALGFPGYALVALLQPVPLIIVTLLRSAFRRFLGRWYLTHSHSSPGAVDRAGYVPAFLAGGYSIPFASGFTTSTPTRGSPLRVLPLVTRSSCSCGRWFLTRWRYPQSALGRWCLRLLADRWSRPSFLLQGGSSSLSPLLSSSNLSVPKNPKSTKHDCLQSLPPSSRNHRLIIH